MTKLDSYTVPWAPKSSILTTVHLAGLLWRCLKENAARQAGGGRTQFQLLSIPSDDNDDVLDDDGDSDDDDFDKNVIAIVMVKIDLSTSFGAYVFFKIQFSEPPWAC